MQKSLIFTTLAAAACTFLPRFLPFLLQNLKLPPFWQDYLRLMPVAALGALIVPSAFETIPDAPWAAIAGVLAAGVWSFFRGGLIIPVMLALTTTFVLIQIPH